MITKTLTTISSDLKYSSATLTALIWETVKETVFNTFNKYAPIKRKYDHANEAPFMTKEFQEAIMKRSRVINKFLKDRTENNQKNFSQTSIYLL